MSSIMSMFQNAFGGSGQQAPASPTSPTSPTSPVAPVPGQIQQGAATGAADPTVAPNGIIPPGTDKAAATPLDQFTDLWKNEPTDPNAPPKSNSVFGNVDPAKFMEAAGRIDFSQAVTPEQLQAITTGGEGAMQAFAQAMNKVAQNVYAQSAFATTKIVDQALQKARGDFVAEIPQHIKRSQVNDNLRSENPIFSNPAVRPIISALESQMTVKFPNATATEITAMAKQYVEALGTSFAPKPASSETAGAKTEPDWNSFF